jgi:Na+/proline symporter
MEGGQSGEVGRNRGEGRLYNFFMALTIIGCFVILGVSVVYYFEGYCGIFECILAVPYGRAPVVLAFLAILSKWFEKLWGKPPPPAAS